MHKRGEKKGLSTIVITLIIILVSLVAVGIIWVVVRNVIQKGSEGIAMGQFTLDAKIMNVNLENSSNNVNLTVKRNPGEGEFTSLKFIFYDGKDSEVITEQVSLNELEERRFNFHLNLLNVSRLVSISIVPILNKNGKDTIGNVLDKYIIGGNEQFILPVGSCTPATCSALGYVCGTWTNGTCAGTLNCGTCGSGYSCNASGRCVVNPTGNIYYVDKDAVGANDGSSWVNAYTEIQAVFDNRNIEPDDIILLAGGTYQPEDIHNGDTGGVNPGSDDNGIIGHPVTIRVASGETVILNGGGTMSHAFSLTNAAYYVIDGFQMDNFIGGTTGGSIYANGGATGLIIRNNSINIPFYAATDDSQQGIVITDTSNITVEYNTITSDTGDWCAQTDGIVVAYVTGAIIRYNSITLNNNGYCNIADPLDNKHIDGIQTWQCVNLEIYGNYINHAVDGQKQGIYCEGIITGNLGYWKVYNNVVEGYFGSRGITLQEKIATVEQHVYNNVVMALAGQCYVLDGENVYFKNNIGISNGNIPVVWFESATQTANRIDYNCYYNYGTSATRLVNTYYTLTNWQSLGYDINSNNLNPNLDSNYKPTETSISITDRGTNLNIHFTTDKNGIMRPQGSAWDIGAYEYAGTPTGNFRYVRQGATGNNNGSDWANAYTTLPATLLRNYTYYIADGSYAAYTFNDAESGTQYITIKKAIESNHGTNTGWSSSYGDGQALFPGTGTIWNIETGYWIIDGQTGTDQSGYGFKLDFSGTTDSSRAFNIDGSFITIKYVDIEGNGHIDVNQSYRQDGIYVAGNPYTNLTFANNYIHDWKRCGILLASGVHDIIIENNFIARTYSTSEAHGQAIQMGPSADSYNVDFRYNKFYNIQGSGFIFYLGGSSCIFHDIDVYGNIFYTDDPTNWNTATAIGTNSDTTCNNCNVYGNTFYGLTGRTTSGYLELDYGYGTAKNNIIYNCNSGFQGTWTVTHTASDDDYSSQSNFQLLTSNPFIDSANGDFRLAAATDAGDNTISPEYSLDIIGNVRGTDGNWDRGAYEF